MLQVDENIGGRQDQKNQNLRTKTLAVGLMMVLGCFAAMGYFSATTTTTATDTRVSSPKGDGMVSNLQKYPYVTITNKTPKDTFPNYIDHDVYGFGDLTHHTVYVVYNSGLCSTDYIDDGLAPGGTWTASSRGACLVKEIVVTLTHPWHPDGLACAPYTSSGTSYSIYSILMKGDDACCVLSSHETPQKCP